MSNRTFIRIFAIGLGVISFCIFGFSKEVVVQSTWAAVPVVIDGSGADWQGEALNFEKKVEVDYAFKNDAQHIYLIFAFKNPMFLSTIRFTGLTIWFNFEGKKDKTYGINFKEKRLSADELIATLEKQHGQLPEERKNQIKASPFYFFYQGEVIDKKKNILTASAVRSEKDVPIFREKRQQKEMTYEIKIPLNILEKLPGGKRIEPGSTVKIGFEWGGMTKEILEQKAGELGASSSRAREGAAEMATDEERSERTGDSASLSSVRRGTIKHNFWADVKLAQSQ